MRIFKLIKNAILGLALLTGTSSFAANHYIRAGASGSNNGTDWTNAWTSLASVSWVRGDVYYISSGSYGNFTFGTATSGSTVIEIRGAIDQGDHGTATGWNPAFQGTALLGNGGSTFSTSYWKVNGQAVPGCSYPSNNPACYTIKFQNPASGNNPTSQQTIFLCDGASFCTNYTLSYVDVLGSNTTQIGGTFTDEGIVCRLQCSQVMLDHDYIHQSGCDLLSFNEFGGDIITIQYDWLDKNDVGLGNISGTYAHCQGIQSTMGTMIIRYNVWQDMQSSGAITLAAGGNGAPIVDWEVYGNIFFWDAAWNAAWSGNGSVGYDDGIVGIFDETQGCCSTAPLKIYNNLIWGAGLASSQNCNMQLYTINANEFVLFTGYNNMFANFKNSCNAGSAGAGTYDYNSYYQIANGTNDSGAHSTTSASAAPLSNPSTSTIAGFTLTANTSAGLSLAAPYNTDLFGTTRGVNGTWDRGWYQIAGAIGPAIPTGLTVFIIQ